MTDPAQPRKSRRRFLADLLFVGGGLSAAALLAKSQLGSPPDVTPAPTSTPAPACTKSVELPPDVAGEMVVPEPPISKGEAVAPQPEGRMVTPPPEELPAIDGDYVAPTPPKTKGDYAAPAPPPPGKPAAPRNH